MKTTNLLPIVLSILALTACGPGSATDQQDGAPADAERVIDAGPPPDAIGPDFGQSCTTAADCPNGFCVEGPTGDVCTYRCEDNCPLGWECRVTEVDGVLASLCLPQIVSQCVSCTDDDQCPGGACIDIGGGSYCLPSCFEGACPDGYSCGDDPSGEHPGGFCVPDTGSCDCNADNDGNVRTCNNMNGIGTCYGIEVCDGTTGWGSCNAPTASTEICNGADDDCDFLIDDGVQGGAACDITNANGTCQGTSLCTGVGGVICQGQTPGAEICDYTDNDCDAQIDEGYPNVNDLCSDGDGVCERFGVIRCDSAGTGTECSAVAGPPATELCNQLDDDCMGDIDENFPTLGNPCSAGVGVCQRQGNLVCNVAQTGTTCSATAGTAGTETCNTLDDDCDGPVDENWKTGGVYTSNQACGSCAVDCTVIYGLAHANGTCNSTGTPTCQMNCATNYYNLNAVVGDGCEFLLDTNAIYVSKNDTGAVDNISCGLGPVGTVAGYHPCASVNYGLGRANALNKARILVANGIYAESLTLVNGRNMMGGYLPNSWARDLAATGTMLTSFQPLGIHQTVVDASSITGAVGSTTFEGFVLFAPVNANVGGNSYGIYALNSTSALVLNANVIFGGRGGPGSSGTSQVNAANGNNGASRSAAASDPAWDAKVASASASPCTSGNDRASSGGGASACGGPGAGGNGGGNICAPASACTTCSGSTCTYSTCTFVEASGQDGGAGTNGTGGALGGTSGDAGYDEVLRGTTCYFSSSAALGYYYGSDGGYGTNGVSGAAVTGCPVASNVGTIASNHWVGIGGNNGNAGTHGGGGAGGGAGGGSKCQGGVCTSTFDNLGAHGGGGGSGGCGGTGGGAATAGGGAFDIFLVGTGVPAITNNKLTRGEGGSGGQGGNAGNGGSGGVGGYGGISDYSIVYYCAEAAGRGGNGGDGGHGSGGGGGCGGVSEGIYTSGIAGTPNYCTTAANTFTGGVGGGGGAGGFSLVNPGGTGSSGDLGTCSYH